MDLWTFLFPQNSIFLSLVLYGEQILYYNVLFDCRQIMLPRSPVFEGTLCRLLYSVILSSNKASSSLGQKQTLWIRFVGFHEAARSVWKQQSWRSSLTDAAKQSCYSEPSCICELSCKLLLPSLIFSKYIHTCQQIRAGVQVAWYSWLGLFLKKWPILTAEFLLAAEKQDMS